MARQEKIWEAQQAKWFADFEIASKQARVDSELRHRRWAEEQRSSPLLSLPFGPSLPSSASVPSFVPAPRLPSFSPKPNPKTRKVKRPSIQKKKKRSKDDRERKEKQTNYGYQESYKESPFDAPSLSPSPSSCTFPSFSFCNQREPKPNLSYWD